MQYSDQKHEMPTSFSATCVIFAFEHKTCIHNEEGKREKIEEKNERENVKGRKKKGNKKKKINLEKEF
jgi:hypothetical protein